LIDEAYKLARAGKYIEAIACCEILLDRKLWPYFGNPYTLDAEYVKASSLMDLGQWETAVIVFDTLIAKHPPDIINRKAKNNKGRCLVSLGRFEEAILAFNDAIKTDIYYQLPSINLIDVLVKLGRLDEALRACDKALFYDKELRACSNSSDYTSYRDDFQKRKQELLNMMATKEELAQRRLLVTFESIMRPFFRLSKSNFEGDDEFWIDQLRAEKASHYFSSPTPPPHGLGNEFVAEYFFMMGNQANSRSQALGAYYHALELYYDMGKEAMIAKTCLEIGGTYLEDGNLNLAQIFFLQSAYLFDKISDKHGYSRAVFRMGEISQKQNNVVIARQFYTEALPLFKVYFPEEVSKVEKYLRNLEANKN